MESQWPCLTCASQERSFCAALLGKLDQAERLRRQPRWQEFKIARTNDNILKRGDVSRHVYVLCEGWAARLFRLVDGSKQILNFLLPADLFFPLGVFSDRIDSSFDALSDVQFSRFDRGEVLARLRANPAITTALVESKLAERTAGDELLTVLGKRSAEERVAYLFLHLMKRIADRNVIREHRYAFPLRQQQIADFTGLTPVHVSRVIGAFRDRGLVELSGGVLQVMDVAELERIGAMQ